MAYLKAPSAKQKRKTWSVSFRWDDIHYTRSCRTKREAVAQRQLATVQETIALLQTGRLTIPATANPGDWIVSGGKAISKPKRTSRPSSQRLSVVCQEYLDDQVGKADTTIAGERIHLGRIQEIIRPSTSLSAIDLDVLKRYAKKRAAMQWRGKPITGTTIRKELVTLKQVWRWAKQNQRIDIPCPLYDEDGKWQIPLANPAEGKRFQTWRQIKRQVIAGNLSDEEQQELWRGLYLDNDQVVTLLEHIQQSARHAFIYPMAAFVAYTGCRRSEMLRSQIIDIDFDDKQIVIRERKRRKDLSSSTRIVPLHPRLSTILEQWLDDHPGGKAAFNTPKDLPGRYVEGEWECLTKDQAHDHFKTTLAKSKWSVVPGFHVLRHSFGANLARSGQVSETTIGKWMGHTTKEMRSLYQHLFPQDGTQQIGALL